jgi:hypothetical protein
MTTVPTTDRTARVEAMAARIVARLEQLTTDPRALARFIRRLNDEERA